MKRSFNKLNLNDMKIVNAGDGSFVPHAWNVTDRPLVPPVIPAA